MVLTSVSILTSFSAPGETVFIFWTSFCRTVCTFMVSKLALPSLNSIQGSPGFDHSQIILHSVCFVRPAKHKASFVQEKNLLICSREKFWLIKLWVSRRLESDPAAGVDTLILSVQALVQQSIATPFLFNRITTSLYWGLTFLPTNCQGLLRKICQCKNGKITLIFLMINEFWNVNPSAHTLRAEIVALHMPSLQYSIQKAATFYTSK